MPTRELRMPLKRLEPELVALYEERRDAALSSASHLTRSVRRAINKNARAEAKRRLAVNYERGRTAARLNAAAELAAEQDGAEFERLHQGGFDRAV